MAEVTDSELRDDTAGVLRRVQGGERVTVNGRAAAELVPVQRSRRAWLGRDDLLARLGRAQADPGLRADLAELAGDTTDDLGPIRRGACSTRAIASESGRPLRADLLPDESAVSVVTLAELQAGVPTSS